MFEKINIVLVNNVKGVNTVIANDKDFQEN